MLGQSLRKSAGAWGNGQVDGALPKSSGNSAGKKTKETLIIKAIDYILAKGLRDFSLRSISAEMGTSHRVLSYHFGSKEEFIQEVMNSVFQSWLQIISDIDIEHCSSSSEALLLLWDRISHPDVFIYSRIGFEMIAWKGRMKTRKELMPESFWSEPLERVSRLSSLDPSRTEADVRVMRVVVRGLISQLAATDNPDECRRSLLDFLDWRDKALLAMAGPPLETGRGHGVGLSSRN